MTRAPTVTADGQPILPLLLRRDRLPVALGLVGVTVLAWLYLVWMAHAMPGTAGMARMAMPMIAPWSAADWLAMFLMWAIMMVGMMLPSAAPMILLYDRVRARQEARGASLAATGVFALGYLLAWTLFSLGATTAQWALEQAALLSPMMVEREPVARRRAPDRGRALPMDAAQARLPGPLPLADHLPRPPLAPRAARARCGWASITASTASAAAGC